MLGLVVLTLYLRQRMEFTPDVLQGWSGEHQRCYSPGWNTHQRTDCQQEVPPDPQSRTSFSLQYLGQQSGGWFELFLQSTVYLTQGDGRLYLATRKPGLWGSLVRRHVKHGLFFSFYICQHLSNLKMYIRSSLSGLLSLKKFDTSAWVKDLLRAIQLLTWEAMRTSRLPWSRMSSEQPSQRLTISWWGLEEGLREYSKDTSAPTFHTVMWDWNINIHWFARAQPSYLKCITVAYDEHKIGLTNSVAEDVFSYEASFQSFKVPSPWVQCSRVQRHRGLLRQLLYPLGYCH